MHSLKTKIGADGTGTVLLDGIDLSDSCHALSISYAGGEVPEVTLELLGVEVEFSGEK